MDNFKEDFSSNDPLESAPPPLPAGEKEEVTAQAKPSTDQNKDEAQKKAAQTERPFYKRWWFWIVVILLIGYMNGRGKKTEAPDNSSKVSTEPVAQVESKQESSTPPISTISEASSEQNVQSEPSEVASDAQDSKSSLTPEEDRYAFISKYEAELRVITKEMLSRSLNEIDYKIPWSETWRIVPFDDQAIFVTTKASIDGMAEKQPVIAIFNYYPDEKRWDGHFLSVGDYVLYDDHYADEFFENISAWTNGG